jgi:decaprenylphospho-beta-D-ribofuranose 2-oxidase
VTLSGWGNYPRVAVRRLQARGAAAAVDAIGRSVSLIARGNGRSYGDSALNRTGTLSMLPSNRFLEFDSITGRLTCEAGVVLADLLAVFVPRGWFPPVTPGTKFVTIGGMVASDVHGKNHHCAGTFGAHVDALELALADGAVVRCSATENAALFSATKGGMGLTGVILTVTFRMMRIQTRFMKQTTTRARNLGETMRLSEEMSGATYQVAWLDCLARGNSLGRSLLYCGEHAAPDELLPDANHLADIRIPKYRTVPFNFPAFALNRFSVAAFNAFRYGTARDGTMLIDYDPFFYPLDALLEWNRIYGRTGFVQYQCVLPKAASAAGMTVLLERIAASGKGSFLAVLKLFGKCAPAGLMSFPMEGYTLALDFPADAVTFALFTELDAIVADHGGRLYMAKDARAGPAMLRRGYPNLSTFQATRLKSDPGGKFSSVQSHRLEL